MADDWNDLASREGQLVESRFRLGEPLSKRASRALRLHDRAPAELRLITLDGALQAEFEQPFEGADHPGVQPVWARGVLEPGLGYLITPEPLGVTLDDVLEEGPLELERALSTLEGLVSAMQAVHATGQVLVNLRPVAIRMVPGWSREQVRIPAGPWSLGPAAGHALGGYCAPEVAYSAAGPRADQFSLGVIAFELLTGTPPHNPEAPPGDRTQVPFLPNPGVPDEMGPLLRRLLAETPDGRFPDLPAVAAELARLRKQLVRDEPNVGHFTPIIPAGRTTLPERLLPSVPPPLFEDDDIDVEPRTDNIVGTLLLLFSVFACAMGLSYAIFLLW
ncbi:MAG: hypothetical protein R3F61_28815 [Myxococcota bacterium]